MRLPLVGATVLLLLTRPVLAEDPYQPTARERAWYENCLGQHESSGTNKALAACAERITAACLGLEDSPKLPAVPGRNSHPDSCAPVEERLWDGSLNEAYRKLMAVLDADGRAKVQKAQRAWLAYREAACAVYEIQPSPLGSANTASCRLDETARRALDLRALLADAAPQ